MNSIRAKKRKERKKLLTMTMTTTTTIITKTICKLKQTDNAEKKHWNIPDSNK